MCIYFEQIDEDLIKKFTYVAGIVPVLKAYIKEVKNIIHSYILYITCMFAACTYI